MSAENAMLVDALVEQARVRLERAEQDPVWIEQALERLNRALALGAGENVKKALAAKTSKDALAALSGEPEAEDPDKTPDPNKRKKK